MRIFGSGEAQTKSTTPFLYIIIFQRWVSSFEPPSSTPEGEDICADGLFCMKFNFEQLLFKPFFDVIRTFGASSPKLNLLPLFIHYYFFNMGIFRAP